MHILTIDQSETLYQDANPVDLDQPAGKIILLSAADTDIRLWASATKRQTMDGVRIASIQALNHPFSIDLYLEKTCKQAKIIVVRLLGGVNYWSYGVDELTKLAKNNGIKLLLLPADGKPDQELYQRSQIDEHSYQLASRLLDEGGPANADHFLALLNQLTIYAGDAGKLPDLTVTSVPSAGIYWPSQPSSLPIENFEALRTQIWRKNRPVVALLFYRALLLADDLHSIQGMITALSKRGLNPLPIFVSSLKDQEAAQFTHSLMEKAQIDLILNTTAFAISDGTQAIGKDLNDQAPFPFNVNDAPILQIALSSDQRKGWQKGMTGMNSRDLAMNIVLPELDGRLFTRIVGFKSPPSRDPLTHAFCTQSLSHRQNAEFVSRLAKNWIALRHRPNPQKRIAIILANYPNRDGRLANGVGLDTPQSVVHCLQALKKQGYAVDTIPDSGDALINHLKQGVTNQKQQGRIARVSYALDAYQRDLATLPKTMRNQIEAHWGEPANDPFVENDKFHLPIAPFGNAYILIQPARGYQIDPKESYHSPDLVPPHGYLACYLWLRYHGMIDAVIHFGKHGNLEWLPGKAVGLSNLCYPQAILGATPHLYPFIVNDPGEGTQAKRRTQAVILDHLIPPMTQAGLYGDTAELESKMDEFYEAQGLDPARLELLQQDILTLSERTGIDHDCGIDQDSDTLETKLLKLDNFLCDIKELQIRDGLHCFGKSPTGAEADHLLAAILRTPRGSNLYYDHNRPQSGLDQSLLRALSDDLALEFDPLTAEGGEPYHGVRPSILQTMSDQPWRINGDTVDRLESLALALISGEMKAETVGAHSAAIIYDYLPALRECLNLCGVEELKQLIRGLNGDYIPAGASGAPTRGKPEILPTGRNFYSMDSRALPTEAAWRLGQLSANALLERYLQDHGDWPRAMTLSAWGTSNMRTGGDDIAQALALIGVQPVWEGATRRVTGIEVIPLSVLDRPRVDITIRCSGFFRDAFPAQIQLLDKAMRKVMQLEESEAENPLKKHRLAHYQTLCDQGVTPEEAELISGFRIFSTKPGSYGAGLQTLMDEGIWQERGDFGRNFIDWSGYAYGAVGHGIEAKPALKARLNLSDAIIHNQDNREHDILDSDDYYQFEGGLSAAIHSINGRDVPIYHNDHALPEKPVIRSLKQEIGRVVKARAANPKWIDGVMRHGYKGAFEIAATVDYLFAFAATTRQVDAHHFKQCFDAYLGDERVRQFLQTHNEDAYKDIINRFEEAINRHLWHPKSNSIPMQLANLKK